MPQVDRRTGAENAAPEGRGPGDSPEVPLGAGAMPSETSIAVRPYGKYFLVRKLAEGGMAEIFLAKQVGAEGFERNVVIKRMLQHLSSVPDFVTMFLDEARLAARLAHPNIVQINDLGLADACYYICMEYLAGEDFSTVLRTAVRRREALPLAVVLRVVADAAHGLHFAHQFTDELGAPLNIVHRDISPSNILVTYQGQAKLLDFGIAKAESRVTKTTAGVVKGKYMYMAPEQAAGNAVDRRADVFSLGVCLYEAVTQHRPFARDNDLAILNAVLNCDFEPPRKWRPDLPADLERIILKALARRAEDRFQSAGQLATELESCLTGLAANTSTQLVGQYLESSFGPERIASKTRIPSLSGMAASGVDVPGFSNPLAPKTDPEGQLATAHRSEADAPPTLAVRIKPLGPKALEAAASAATEVAEVSSSEPTASAPGRIALGPMAKGALLGAALVAAALGGVFVSRWSGASEARSAPGPALAPMAADPQPSSGTTAPVPTPPAPVQSAPVAATAVESPPSVGTRPAPREPVLLSLADVQRVVAKQRKAFMSCFEANKASLDAEQGTTNVQISILSSGRVASVTTDVGGPLGQCLQAEAKRLRFPVHRDKEVTLTLPLAFEVKR